MKLVLIAICLLCPLMAMAQGGDGRPCDASTLKDDYGLLVTGIRAIGPVTETFTTLAMVSFDGRGAFTAKGESHGLTTGIRKAVSTGTYTVNSDCTGTWTTFIPGVPPIVADFVIVDRGQEVRVISSTPGEVSSGNARKK